MIRGNSFLFSLFVALGLLILSCKSGENGNNAVSQNPDRNIPDPKAYSIAEPTSNSYQQPGDPVTILLSQRNPEKKADSVWIEMAEEKIAVKFQDEAISYTLPAINPGRQSLKIRIGFEDGSNENHSLNLRILSDITPDEYTYRVVETFPHDRGAFTQGLEYADGYLLEGTGNYGESSLRKVDIETGEILKFRSLPSDIFGEGVTRVNSHIFQITYRAQVGFVYDENDFEIQRKIYYQIREGWGLTNNGEHILMSDGSHRIYFMDTTYFSVVKSIEVFDNNAEVDMLNELELIDGILYANRYTTREIVMIDPESGKLLGRIDLEDILDERDRHPRIDFFNGIAYDPDKDRILVTGKYWPKLYHVEFVKLP